MFYVVMAIYGLLVIGGLLLGGFCFDYALYAFVDKDIPFWADVLAAACLAEGVIPVALILWIAALCGLTFPIF